MINETTLAEFYDNSERETVKLCERNFDGRIWYVIFRGERVMTGYTSEDRARERFKALRAQITTGG